MQPRWTEIPALLTNTCAVSYIWRGGQQQCFVSCILHFVSYVLYSTYTHDTYASPYPRPTTTSSSLTRPLPYFRKAKKVLASSHRSKAIRIITFDRATTSGVRGGVSEEGLERNCRGKQASGFHFLRFSVESTKEKKGKKERDVICIYVGMNGRLLRGGSRIEESTSMYDRWVSPLFSYRVHFVLHERMPCLYCTVLYSIVLYCTVTYPRGGHRRYSLFCTCCLCVIVQNLSGYNFFFFFLPSSTLGGWV